MADGGNGFVGFVEMVRRTRGIVAGRRLSRRGSWRRVFSLERGLWTSRARHDLAPHQVSDWRRLARQGLLALPAEAIEAVSASAVAAFVPVSVYGDPDASSEATDAPEGVIGIELCCGLVVRVPGDVSAERAAALVRALRGPA